MTFRLTKTFRFEASHQLFHHDGRCRRLHGHSWAGSLTFLGTRLHEVGPQTGMVLDYARIGKLTRAIEVLFDHRHLNDLLDNPTSERLAWYIAALVYRHVPPTLANSGITLDRVTIEETCTTRCEFSPTLSEVVGVTPPGGPFHDNPADVPPELRVT
jgi:6-pyruvoyltetrahydropterin/6-carboxytetrahydropterin synthase